MATPLFASALSTDPESDAAIEEVARGVLDGLAGAHPDLLAVFVSHHHGPAIETLAPRLRAATGSRVLIGCTGESIVGTAREIERGAALSAWGGVLPGTELRPFVARAAQKDDGTLTFSALPDVRDPARASVLLLADPFTFPAGDYLEVLNGKLPGVPVMGGMASGGTGPGQNLLLTGEGVVDSGAVGVVVEGDVEVVSVVSQGCRPVGKPYVITACQDNMIQKLGGKAAVQVLMDTLQAIGADDRALLQRQPFLGLAVDATKSTFDRGDFLVRGLVGIEPQQGAIAVSDNALRVGQTVQFLVRDAASAGEDLVHLVRERAASKIVASGSPGAGPAPHAAIAPSSRGALLFSCNGRGTRMFQKPDHDIGCVQTAFEERVPAAGFFAMGEIGPVGGKNFLHGFTASVAVFRPRR